MIHLSFNVLKVSLFLIYSSFLLLMDEFFKHKQFDDANNNNHSVYQTAVLMGLLENFLVWELLDNTLWYNPCSCPLDIFCISGWVSHGKLEGDHSIYIFRRHLEKIDQSAWVTIQALLWAQLCHGSLNPSTVVTNATGNMRYRCNTSIIGRENYVLLSLGNI